MTQRNFDPHSQPDESAEQSADSPRLPRPENSTADERLIRPDRQFTYWGLPPDQWPPPILHGHSIAVDRLQADFDGPPHRFLICLGDDVAVFVDSTVVLKGYVADVSHLTQKALVAMRGLGPKWLPKECIYPVPSTAADAGEGVNPLDPNRQIRQLAESDDVPSRIPYSHPPLKTFTFNEFAKLCTALKKGEQSYVTYQFQFERLFASRDALIKELRERFKAPELARLATVFGAPNSKRATKDANAVSIYRAILRTFVLDDTFSCPTTEFFEYAVAKKVRATTRNEHFDYYWRKSFETDHRA